MKKSIIAHAALLAAGGLFTNAASAADVQLYGYVDLGLSYTHTSLDAESSAARTADSSSEGALSLRSNVNKGSRWGLKGSEDLGNGWEAGFVLESGFTPDDGAMTFSNRLFGRQSTVYLKGALGEIAFGRTGALSSGAGTYALTGWGTPFGTSWGTYSVANNNYFFGYLRFDNTVTYRTPEYAGLQFSAQYSFGTDTKKDYDAATDGIQFEEGSSHVDRFAAIGATYKRDALNLALVLDTWDYGNTPTTRDDDDAFTVTATGSYDFGVLRFFAGAQYFENARTDAMKVFRSFDAAASRYQDGFSITTGVNIPAGGGDAKFAAGYFESDPSNDENALDEKTTRWGASAAYEYFLSKRTSIYGVASYANDEIDVRREGSDTYGIVEASIGLTHKF